MKCVRIHSIILFILYIILLASLPAPQYFESQLLSFIIYIFCTPLYVHLLYARLRNSMHAASPTQMCRTGSMRLQERSARVGYCKVTRDAHEGVTTRLWEVHERVTTRLREMRTKGLLRGYERCARRGYYEVTRKVHKGATTRWRKTCTKGLLPGNRTYALKVHIRYMYVSRTWTGGSRMCHVHYGRFTAVQRGSTTEGTYTGNAHTNGTYCNKTITCGSRNEALWLVDAGLLEFNASVISSLLYVIFLIFIFGLRIIHRDVTHFLMKQFSFEKIHHFNATISFYPIFYIFIILLNTISVWLILELNFLFQSLVLFFFIWIRYDHNN